MNQIIPLLLTISFWILLLGIVFVTIADFFFNLKFISLEKAVLKRSPRTRKKLAVVVYASNTAAHIEQCLSLLNKSRFPSLEVVVVDNGSTDQTKAIIKQFQKTHPTFMISTLYKKTVNNKEAAVKQALKKVVAAERILVVDANVLIDKARLTFLRSLKPEEAGDGAVALLPRPDISADYTSVAHGYGRLGALLLIKAGYCFGIPMKLAHYNAVFYSSKADVRKGKAPKLEKVSFLSNLKYFPVHTSSFSWGILFLRFVILIVVPYFVYVAVFKEITILLLYSYLFLVAWLGFVVIPAFRLPKEEKYAATLALPTAYPLLYVANFMQLFYILKAVKNHTYHKGF